MDDDSGYSDSSASFPTSKSPFLFADSWSCCLKSFFFFGFLVAGEEIESEYSALLGSLSDVDLLVSFLDPFGQYSGYLRGAAVMLTCTVKFRV